MGLFNLRDKDKSCFRIFVELIKAAKANRIVSSDELAFRLGLTRGTVIHHINSLISAGIVVHEAGGYRLRVNSLEELVDEVEKDLLRTFDRLKNIAHELDEKIGF